MEPLSFLDMIYEEIVIAITLGTGAGVIAYFRSILRKQNNNANDILIMRKRMWRLERAFALFIKVTVKENKKNHGSSTYDEVEELVDLILKDNPEPE